MSVDEDDCGWPLLCVEEGADWSGYPVQMKNQH
jgi:hypothetical protein